MDDVFDYVHHLGRPAFVLSLHSMTVHEVVAGGHHSLIVCLNRAYIVILRRLHAATGRHSENALVIEINLLSETVSILLSSVVINRNSEGFGLILKADQGVRQVSACDLSEALPV